ncbi:hypothetical protein [Kamptonema formosum]|uniref:hypothetical protein n=1 Tax=Kamptonema formosum TaxID=331992 RepID=UPI000345F290|nr:hypothetical protein [Oscillatoria sp. PCC 10802]
MDSQYSQPPAAQAELELLETLLLADQAYPWNPAEPQSEAFFAALEQEFALEDWPGNELAAQAQAFYTQLEGLWPAAAPAGESLAGRAIASLQASLRRQFAARLPEEWLDEIAHSAAQLLPANLSLGEKLVRCARALLPQWAEEDLQVLARPLAYAMRGNEAAAIESAVAGVRQVPPAELSEIEQARLILAVARYALTELQNYDN